MRVPDKPMEFGGYLQDPWDDREYETDCPYRKDGCLWDIVAIWHPYSDGTMRWKINISDSDGRHSFFAGATLKSMQAAAKRAIETHLRREHGNGVD